MQRSISVPISFASDKAIVPKYATSGSSGADLVAAIDEPITIPAGSIKIIPTGIRMYIPPGYEAQVRSRSGLASKGLFVLNAPGTIDSDYEGEVGVILANFSNNPRSVSPGDRIAQIVFTPTTIAEFGIIDEVEFEEMCAEKEPIVGVEVLAQPEPESKILLGK